MPSVVTYFDPQPAVAELPTVFASPFANDPPDPLARRAVDELAAMLRAGRPTQENHHQPRHLGRRARLGCRWIGP